MTVPSNPMQPTTVEATAKPIFCAVCGKGPISHMVAMDNHLLCPACYDVTSIMTRALYRDCRVRFPETKEVNGQITTQYTGIHWLRENGEHLPGTHVGNLSFPPPKGKTYVAYIREGHRSVEMQDANALIVDDPQDYNMWAGDFSRPDDAVVWYLVPIALLIPYTDFSFF